MKNNMTINTTYTNKMSLVGKKINIFFNDGTDQYGKVVEWDDQDLWIEDASCDLVWINLYRVDFIDVLKEKTE